MEQVKNEQTIYSAAVYCRLSKDDEQAGESVSIETQKMMLTDFCHERGFSIYEIYADDGYSGLNFNRPAFTRLLEDIDSGKVNLVITKDLSRLGRDYIQTGYYTDVYFSRKRVRYIAVNDGIDTNRDDNDIAPFKNILNDMYARDISQKVKNAKHQRAKQGLFIGAQTPYGYQKHPDNKNQLIIDPEAAQVVRLIFQLAEEGLGNIAIASELEARQIITPSVYKLRQGNHRFSQNVSVKYDLPFRWCPATVGQMLADRVYLGELTSLKTEVVNCKTKQYKPVPPERQIVTPNAHEAIITQEQFDRIPSVRANHVCHALSRRDNLFRGKLFCDCCGHPLTISRKQLKHRDADIYFCMYHYHHPDICPKTHRVYHEMLYPYVLQQIRNFAKSMKRRKVNSAIKDYADVKELTPEILDAVIERIEVSHVSRKSRPGNVIRIYWKLR